MSGFTRGRGRAHGSGSPRLGVNISNQNLGDGTFAHSRSCHPRRRGGPGINVNYKYLQLRGCLRCRW